SLQGFSRYDKQNLRYYVSGIFSEDVRTQLMVTDSQGTVHNCFGTQMDTLHVWRLPENLPQGEVDIKVRATNISGLTYTTDIFPDFMDIQYDVVPSHGYVWQEIGPARVPLNYTYDYDDDGYPEYIAMDLPSTGYGQVHVYQPGAAGHQVKHSYDDSFWLLGAGDTNGEGQEILQLKGDTAILLESQLTSTYPHLPMWEDTSITGGVIADYSNDGQDDILLVKNLPAQRVIQAYKRSGNIISPKNVLYNTSETNVRNTFVPTIIVENLDNDSFRDILTADTDGDVMIYEIRNDNLYELAWGHRMSIGNTYSITTGDFDGNGMKDFIVGGYLTDILDPNLNFWLFEGFRNISNNTYASMGTIMFNDVASQNSVRAMDLDSDGKDEIILAIAPNLYILKYEGGEFKPQFYGNSFRTYSILAYKDANDRPYFLTNYSEDADSVFAVEWTSDDPFTGPPTPINFLATPQDEESINLTWISSGADHYNVYRREQDGDPEPIGTSSGTSYTDFGLVAGNSYDYCVSGFDAAYDPPESMPTIWQRVVPDSIPSVTGIAMVSPNQLRVLFSQPMSTSIINPTLYSVDHGMGRPTSVNSVQSGRGIQLQFNASFPAIEGNFILTMNAISSGNGIPLQGSQFIFVYWEDTEAPRIREVLVRPGQESVDILFSEEIAQENPDPEALGNFTFICHSNDTDNEIASAEHLGERIRINLAHKLKFGSSPYLVTIRNIRDLAGNPISLQHNVARFTLVNNHNLDNLIVYPNPVRGGDNQCRFLNFPAGRKGHVRIYDSSGALVRIATIEPFDDQIDTIHKWDWDLRNNAGARVSSGIYFYVIEMDGDFGRGKIAVIN
ncbi:MAG: FG-GAP-like repeat-containing protein, partial [Candidatus Syntrophosphaera sp.]